MEWLLPLGAAAFGGAVTKLIDVFVVQRAKAVDESSAIRKELREEVRNLRAEISSIRAEVDAWRGKYYELLERYTELNQRYLAVLNDLDELRGERAEGHG